MINGLQRWAGRVSKARALLSGGFRNLRMHVSSDTSILVPLNAHAHAWRGLHEDAASIAFLRDSLPHDGTYFDVGANIGVYLCALSAMKGPRLKLAAFEPVPTTVAMLQQTLHLNGVSARIEPIALSSGEGVLRLTAYPNGRNNFWIKESDATHPSISARTRSLDTWLSEHPTMDPDAIKIDVEGHELEVLEGAARLLARRQPALMVECHCASWDELGVSRRRFAELLADLGYRNVRSASGQAVDFLNLRTTVHVFATRE